MLHSTRQFSFFLILWEFVPQRFPTPASSPLHHFEYGWPESQNNDCALVGRTFVVFQMAKSFIRLLDLTFRFSQIVFLFVSFCLGSILPRRGLWVGPVQGPVRGAGLLSPPDLSGGRARGGHLRLQVGGAHSALKTGPPTAPRFSGFGSIPGL